MQSNQSNAPVPVNAYGATTGTVSTGPLTTVLAIKDPTTYDFNYPIKQRWINTASESEFILISFSNVTGQSLATWIPLGSGENIETLTANSGGAVFANASHNINVVGDGTTINIVGNPGTNTLTASLVGGLAAIETITGNTGGAISPDSSDNINIVTANSTVKISGNTGTHTLTANFGLSNLLLGSNGSITSGGANTGYGLAALAATTTGGSNSAFGTDSLLRNVGGGSNSSFGSGSLVLFNPGSSSTQTRNSAFGVNSLYNLVTGTDNIAVGSLAGSSYTSSESSNIVIGNTGTISESNVIRIGTQGSGAGQQNKSFMAGVTGVTAVGSPMAISSTGQMSDLGFGTTGQLLTSNGAGVSPTWKPGITTGGTFTPVLAFGGSSTGITYGIQTGFYTVLANLVFINLEITLTNKGSATGTATISGLPFPVAIDGSNFTLTTFGSNIPANTFSVWALSSVGNSYVTPQYAVTGSPVTGASWDNTFFNNTTVFRIAGFYQYF